jgi:hypothetical protein
MEAERAKTVVKLLPSLADFAFLAPIVLLFLHMNGVQDLLGDGDPGWHIRTGEWILANRRVPTQDLFSFTKPGEPWYAWEWLSDAIFGWLNSHAGLAAVLLLAILLLSTAFLLVFRMARRKSNVFVAIIVTFAAASASSVHWLARPHLFTLLFTVLFYSALERVREGRTRVAGIPYLVMLPLGMVLWTNLHGGFFVGILLAGAYGAGELLRAAFAPEAGERRAALGKAWPYFASAFGCAAATFANPYTWRLHAHVFQYLRDPGQLQHIDEFLSLSFHHPVAIFFELLLAGAVAASVWYASKRSFTEPVLMLMWAHVALLAARNIPIFAIVTAPALAAAVDEWLAAAPKWNVAGWLKRAVLKFNGLAARTGETDSIPRWHVASIAGIVLVAAVFYAPAPPAKFRPEYDPRAYPTGAVEVLRGDASARIFTTDVWAGYLIYRLYPETRVFMDGRSDFYGTEFCENFANVFKMKHGWESILSRFGVNTILLPANVPLAGALKLASGWRLVYDDHVALVFRSSREGATTSAAITGGGTGRDREVTKIQTNGRQIAGLHTKI